MLPISAVYPALQPGEMTTAVTGTCKVAVRVDICSSTLRQGDISSYNTYKLSPCVAWVPPPVLLQAFGQRW